MMLKRCAVVMVATLLLALASAGASARSAPVGAPAGLERFSSCERFLAYVKEQALALPGPWNNVGPSPPSPPNVAMPATPSSVTADQSVTNVQEAGVDEPDIVKNNGSRIFAVAKQKLFAVGVGKGHPHLLGSLPLERGTDHELLLHGNRLLVLSRGGFNVEDTPGPVGDPSRGLPPTPPFWGDTGSGETIPDPGPGTTLTEVDVSDPTEMQVVRTLSIDASYLNARLVGPTARVVLTSQIPQGLKFVSPNWWDPQATADALAQNRAVLASSGAANWLPSYVLRDPGAGGATMTRGSVLGCDQVSRPAELSGLGMLTVLTIDLDKGLQPVDADGVLANGEIVYESLDSLYVATQTSPVRLLGPGSVVTPSMGPGPVIQADPTATALHKFDSSKPNSTDYRASGAVAGRLLNQWSLSEQNGLLRVASTETAADSRSYTRVTVLGEQGGRLAEVGRVGGLGRGEQVYGVRFIGDAGYVVTFRRTDPLYTLDLSRPEHPRVLGKLKLFGWSAYLHPLDEGMLLGVGQDATPFGLSLGTQLSVFDVSDLRRPSRLDRRTINYGTSEVETDHHAFLYWQPERLVVVPVARTGENPFVGVIAYRVNRSRLEEVGRIEAGGRITKLARIAHWNQGERVPIRRSLVSRHTLYTISEFGVRANDVATLAGEGWAAFSEPANARPRGNRSD